MPFPPAFDDDTLKAMRAALDAAEATLVERFGEGRRVEMRAILAEAIYAIASGGQRDADRIRIYAEAKCIDKLTKP